MNYEERDAQLRKRVSDFLKELRAARKKMPLKELARKINVSAQLISNTSKAFKPFLSQHSITYVALQLRLS